MKIKEGGGMDLQKEREAFERLPLAELAIKSEYVFYNEETNSYWPNEDFCPSDAPETMNFAWEAWQAAKAQAVPEGFVLIEKAKLMQIIGSVSMIEPITRGNPYMDSVKRELTAITDVVKTVIKAQEPAND